MNLFKKGNKKIKKIIKSKIVYNLFIRPLILIKQSIWILELLIALFAIFIAYPEYKEFIDKNNVPNINGNWDIEFVTEETSYDDYKGMKIKYNMYLLGNKNKYIGRGEKVRIWDIDLEGNQRDRTEMELIIKGNDIYGIYYLYGKVRNTDGNFKLNLSDDGNSFSGTFVGNAADSKGVVKGVKIN